MIKVNNKDTRTNVNLKSISQIFRVFLLLALSIYIFTGLLENSLIPGKIYLFKVTSRNTRKRCEICSKFTIKITERRHWHRSCVFIVYFKQLNLRLCLNYASDYFFWNYLMRNQNYQRLDWLYKSLLSFGLLYC